MGAKYYESELAYLRDGQVRGIYDEAATVRARYLVEQAKGLRGVAIEGTAEVVEDEAVVWDVCVNIFERYNGEYSEEMKPFVEFMAHNRAAIRLDPQRVRSWDHRKLGLPAMELGGSTAPFVE